MLHTVNDIGQYNNEMIEIKVNVCLSIPHNKDYTVFMLMNQIE